MGFYTTDTLEAAPPRRTSSTRACDGVASERRRARRDPVRSRKPLRGPTRGAISGYRYYSPRLGRWITRDPIGEEGGEILYAMVNNNPVCEIDLNGLMCIILLPEELVPLPLIPIVPDPLPSPENPRKRSECTCEEIRKQRKAIIEQANYWRKVSAGWTWGNQCSEQSGNLITYLKSGYDWW